MYVVAIGDADKRVYTRYSHFGAMKTQVSHGIFDFCVARKERRLLA
ncbi:hypothetical protein ACULMH_05340 [Xanthomonas arboricola pv. corylina]|nr:hypothetical protein [Xanthomonas arboricola]